MCQMSDGPRGRARSDADSVTTTGTRTIAGGAGSTGASSSAGTFTVTRLGWVGIVIVTLHGVLPAAVAAIVWTPAATGCGAYEIGRRDDNTIELDLFVPGARDDREPRQLGLDRARAALGDLPRAVVLLGDRRLFGRLN